MSVVASLFDLLFRDAEKPRNNSEFITVFLILNTMIGSGIMNQPQVFMLAGIVGALLILLVSSFFTWMGLVALIDCGIRHGIDDYSTLAHKAFGVVGEKIMDILIIINNFGSLLSYVTIISGTGSSLIQRWGCYNHPYCGENLLTIFLILGIVLPLCLLYYYGHLGIVSVLSIGAIWCVLIFVLFGGPLTTYKMNHRNINIINANGNITILE